MLESASKYLLGHTARDKKHTHSYRLACWCCYCCRRCRRCLTSMPWNRSYSKAHAHDHSTIISNRIILIIFEWRKATSAERMNEFFAVALGISASALCVRLYKLTYSPNVLRSFSSSNGSHTAQNMQTTGLRF